METVIYHTHNGVDSPKIDKGGGNNVQSVTGLNTDNTDPINPVIEISVDGVTINGQGTPVDPLVSNGGTPASPDKSIQFNNGGSFGGTKITYESDSGLTTLTGADKALRIDTDSGAYLDLGSVVGTVLKGFDGGLSDGDFVAIRAGSGGSGTAEGGVVEITAGSGGSTSGAGGAINIVAGDAQAGDSDGGDVLIQPGADRGTGTRGYLILNSIPHGDPGVQGAVYRDDDWFLKLSAYHE